MPDGSVSDSRPGPLPGRRTCIRDRLGRAVPATIPHEPFDFTAYDLAFVPAADAATSAAGRLYVVSSEGNQAFAFELTADGADGLAAALAPEYFPMRLFGGKGLIASALAFCLL